MEILAIPFYVSSSFNSKLVMESDSLNAICGCHLQLCTLGDFSFTQTRLEPYRL